MWLDACLILPDRHLVVAIAQAPFIKGPNAYELALEAPLSDEEDLEFGVSLALNDDIGVCPEWST